MFDYYLFDFDGTIADTGEGIINSLVFAFVDNGAVPPPENRRREFIGPPVYYGFTKLFGVNEDKADNFIKSYRARYREKGMYESKLFDGVAITLNELKRHGAKLAIASSKPQYLIEAVSEHLGIINLFDIIVGTNQDDAKQPGKAELISAAMQKLNVSDKSTVLMVGDRCFDIDGAKAAGVASCGAAYGFGSREELEKHKADFIIDELKELLVI